MSADCQHCGRARDAHVGLRETCPDLPAQTYQAITARPARTWRCGCEYDYLTGTTTPRCAAHTPKDAD